MTHRELMQRISFTESRACRYPTGNRERRIASTDGLARHASNDFIRSDHVNENSRFFAETLQSRDPVIASEVALELRRQQTQIELIASENIVSAPGMEAQGTVLTNKYAAG